MGNFYSSQHPNAVFVNNFVLSLRFSDRTLSFRNGVLYHIKKNETEVLEVENVEQLSSMINDEFSMVLEFDECRKLYDTMRKIKDKK